MFGGLLESKFIAKCKSLLKTTKKRLETIRKKRSAVQKFLKNDIADLLRNGHDCNAYGRADGLLVEMNMTSCYELVDQFCVCISKHVAAINKQKECPEECKEAIPSLMFAAARLADLPELRDLRDLFGQKYGNSLDPFISQEFAERLNQNQPIKEMKIQLMRGISREFSIDWDSIALDQKICAPTRGGQGLSALNEVGDDDIRWRRSKDHDEWKSQTRLSSGAEAELDSHGEEDDDDGVELKSLPKPRSVRKPLKPSPGHGSASGGCPASGCGTRREDLVPRFRNLGADGDGDGEENDENTAEPKESKTGLESRKGKLLLKPPPGRETIKTSSDHFRRCSDPVVRSSHEPRGHARAKSLQPDLMGQTGHVHPKLPDYDDLAARLAALREA